jgi:hypothetical protein
MAGQAFRHIPLLQTSGANSARVKGVPQVAATALPAIFAARRPAAFRATDVIFVSPGDLPQVFGIIYWQSRRQRRATS